MALSPSSRWVYPRACGGAPRCAECGRRPSGLSPRMRGSRKRSSQPVSTSGSIPAHAGEPLKLATMPSTDGVYPRACGGAWGRRLIAFHRQGLSPRMRGSPLGLLFRQTRFGSIPAHAGEPPACCRPSGKARVYPRACGGVGSALPCCSISTGLSPRMRGSRADLIAHRHRDGSIPAHAGEPCSSLSIRAHRGVYPRACGGAHDVGRGGSQRWGLSPRMRGSHRANPTLPATVGSIPAHAGEPHRRVLPPGRQAVYPRACGGAPRWTNRTPAYRGLSPRMRGSRVSLGLGAVVIRSIPAHAGEPLARVGTSRLRQVYPRACGGASRS